MAAVTANTLVAVLKGKSDSEMIYVRVKDRSGHRYNGKISALHAGPHKPVVDVQALDGEMKWGVPVPAILWVDVRPRLDYPVAEGAI